MVNKKTHNWKFFIFFIIVILVLLGIESASYFWVAIACGKRWYPNSGSGLNLRTPIDEIIPWCSWTLPFYLSWIITWPILIPLFIWYINGGNKANGKEKVVEYFIHGIIFYSISTILYAIIPTTCDQNYYMDKLHPNDPFWWFIKNKLASNSNNVFGSCPSYHNYWASLFVFYGLMKKNQKKIISYIGVGIGLLITFSTLTLHQHNIADVIVTYGMTFTILIAIRYFNLTSKFLKK